MGRKVLIGVDDVNELGSDLDRLKQSASNLPEREQKAGNNLLDAIEEEDLPDLDFEDERENRHDRLQVIEPDQNMSCVLSAGKVEHAAEAHVSEEWIQETLINLVTETNS